MIRAFRSIRSNWRKNYRHHGGVSAVTRCLAGTLAVRLGIPSHQRAEPGAVEILSFSVVPWMTALWARLLLDALSHHDTSVVIGDSSGGFGQAHHRLIGDGQIRVIPCLNDHHGEKIDLFLAKVCREPYVVIADDDVFWLSEQPLVWALAHLDADPRVAAVSLMPRRDVSSLMRREGVAQPMGSHCLVIRRELFRREQLSFAVAPAPAETDDWFYDTGDLANRELLARDYRVVAAVPEIRRHFVVFDGVSSWILKLQGLSPDQLALAVTEISLRQRKALEAVFVARGLAALLAELSLAPNTPEIIPEQRLSMMESVLVGLASEKIRFTAQRAVEEKLRRLRCRMTTPDP